MSLSFREQVASLPEQLRTAPSAGGGALPGSGRLVIGGMGGSAAAGEFLAAALGSERECLLVRDEVLPAGAARGDRFLAISYSGETSETLALWREAGARGLDRAAVASGGALLAEARTVGAAHAQVPAGWAPRTALGHLLRGAWLLAAGDRDPGWGALADHLAGLAGRWTGPGGEAERLAARLERSFPVLLAAGPGPMAAARRWAAVLAENAKTPSSLWEFPEAAHNLVMALAGPSPARTPAVLLALGGPAAGPGRERWEAALSVLARHGGAPEPIDAPHPDPWVRALGIAYLGDWSSLILAERLGVDPESLSVINDIKHSLRSGKDIELP